MTKVNPNAKKSGYSLEDVCLTFIERARFYTVLLSKITKVPLKEIPTAGVGFNKHGKLTLFYNPEYVKSLPLGEAQGLIEHECEHIVFRHLSRFPMKGTLGQPINSKDAHDNKLINWGADCAINQYIPVLPTYKKGDKAIGQKDIMGRIIKEGDSVGLYPETFDFKKDEAADIYIAALRKMFPEPPKSQMKMSGQGQKGEGDKGQNEQGQSGNDGDQQEGSLDSHELWGKVVDVDSKGNLVSVGDVADHPDVDPEYECEAIVTKAIKECKDFGKLPAHIQRELERLKTVKRHDWKKTLNVFINTVLTMTKHLSQKRVNKRLFSVVDYLAPGKKKSRKPKVLYVRDTSGSMFSDKVQVEINNELEQLAKRCEVFVADCDTKVHQSYKFRKSSDIKPYKGGGGTSFVDAFKEAKKLGVDGVIYATDTYGDFPQPKEIGKFARSTIWLTFNQDQVSIPFGRHVNINPSDFKK
jgi:predicted metal-dependent peptidase